MKTIEERLLHKKFREQGLFGRAADLMTEGGGVTSSMGQALSDVTKAKMTGMKETLDPMNIARFLTGSEKFMPALVGKLTGRSKEDIKYFTTKNKASLAGGSATKIGSLEHSNEMVDALLKIYNFMRDTDEKETKHKEKENQFKEEKESEKLRRHNELIAAITGKKVAEVEKESPQKKEEDDTDIIDTVTRIKALKDILGGLGAATTVAGTVGIIGAALSYLATGIMSSPLADNFNRAISSDPMLGAMAGDAAFAGGILSANQGETPEAIRERQQKLKKLLKDTPGYTRIYGVGRDSALKEKGLDSDQISEITGKGSLADLKRQKEEMETTLGSRKWMDKEDGAKYDKIVSEIARKEKKLQQEPSTPPAVPKPETEKASPVSATPPSAEVSSTTTENRTLKLQNPAPEVPVVERVENNVSSAEEVGLTTTLPSIRNSEETYQQVVYYNTRVV